MLIKIGKLLYKYRALVAVPFFVLVVYKSRPARSLAIPLVLTLAGLVMRSWAAGYIGRISRSRAVHSPFRIASGPYRWLRHPLYIGNFLLVCGTIVLYNPAIWIGAGLAGIFLVEYGLFAVVEERHLKGAPVHKERFAWSRLKLESSTWLVVFLVWVIYFLRL